MTSRLLSPAYAHMKESKALLRRWLSAVRLRKSAGLPDDQPTAAETAARSAFFDYIEEIDR